MKKFLNDSYKGFYKMLEKIPLFLTLLLCTQRESLKFNLIGSFLLIAFIWIGLEFALHYFGKPNEIVLINIRILIISAILSFISLKNIYIFQLLLIVLQISISIYFTVKDVINKKAINIMQYEMYWICNSILLYLSCNIKSINAIINILMIVMILISLILIITSLKINNEYIRHIDNVILICLTIGTIVIGVLFQFNVTSIILPSSIIISIILLLSSIACVNKYLSADISQAITSYSLTIISFIFALNKTFNNIVDLFINIAILLIILRLLIEFESSKSCNKKLNYFK